jgi:hypothetical protein
MACLDACHNLETELQLEATASEPNESKGVSFKSIVASKSISANICRDEEGRSFGVGAVVRKLVLGPL